MNLTDLEPKKILVIKLKHIGDLIVTIPALRALKERWPASHLAVLVNKGMGELITELPYIDEIIYFDRQAIKGKWIAERRFVSNLRRRQFDLSIDFTGGERSAWYTFGIGARIRIGVDDQRGFPGRRWLYHKVIPWGSGHYVDNHLAVISPLGVIAGNRSLEVAIPVEAKASAAAKLSDLAGSFCIIHPTSRWMFKSWPAASCTATIENLQSLGFEVVITSGPDEKERRLVAEIMDGITQKKGVYDLSGKTTLPELAAIISRSRLFLGVDSAPLHIASAVRTPVVVLFGPSGVHNWGPWMIPHRVITAKRECSPCGKDGCDGSKRSDCLEEIGVEQIMQAVNELLMEGQ